MGYVKDGVYHKGDPSSSDIAPKRQPLHAQHEVERMREDFRKDLIQPYLPNGKPNPDFIDAYPKQAEGYGFVNKEEKNV